MRVGTAATGKLTVDAGAKLEAAKLSLGPTFGTDDATNSVVVAGGEMKIRSAATLGCFAANSEQSLAVESGSLFAYPGAWLNLAYGFSTFSVADGMASLSKFAFGYGGSAVTDYSTGKIGAKRTLAVSGGAAEVRDSFSWGSDTDHGANSAVKISGGSLALPPTVRPQEANGFVNNSATLEIDGGALAFNGAAGLSGATAADYLHGADSVAVGENGATVSSASDATVKQPVRGTSRAGGDFVKRGAGTLTLDSANVVFGAVDVREGKLVAPVEQRAGANTPYPAGLLALWDFDGDDPLADKSGHGRDLVQYSEAHPVQFTEGDADKGFARSGKCAYWDGTTCAVICTNLDAAPLRRSTCCTWFRIKTWNSTPHRNRNLFSTRPRKTLGKDDNSGRYDFTLKGPRNLESCWGGDKANFRPDYDITTETWHHFAVVRDFEKMDLYYDGVCVTNHVYESCRDDYVVNAGNLFSIGMGIANSEFMCLGGMIDDVAVFGRCLSADEIAALYADAPCASTNAVKVAAGAEWDMAGADAVASSLAGGGRVTNGKLTLVGSLMPSAAGAPYVENLVVASDAGTIDLARADDPLPQIGVVDLLSFGALDADSSANLAKWSVVNTGLSRRVRAHLNLADGKLSYETEGIGTVLIVR